MDYIFEIDPTNLILDWMWGWREREVIVNTNCLGFGIFMIVAAIY